MNYSQIKQPNLSVVGQEGLCLAYVTEVFGVPNDYPSATVAWEDAQFKHPGEQPPIDVAVPVWFSYNGPDGHVAVSVPGKGIYSTSAQGDKVFGNVAELVSWMGEGMTYLGWSEDINTIRVVEGEEEMVDDATARAMLSATTILAQDGAAPDRQPTTQEVENLIGRTPLDALNQIMTYQPWKNNYAKVKYYDNDVATAAKTGVNKSSVQTYINQHLS